MKIINKMMSAFLVASICVGFMACSQTKKEETTQSISKTADETGKKGAGVSSDKVQAILSAYLKIKDALIDTNGEAASQAAIYLATALEDASGDGLQMKIKNSAQNILLSKDPKNQREDFNILSQNIYALLKSSGSTENTVYRQYCPMAFNNTGAFWLSAEDEILNPYFGDKMLTCGAIDETIN